MRIGLIMTLTLSTSILFATGCGERDQKNSLSSNPPIKPSIHETVVIIDTISDSSEFTNQSESQETSNNNPQTTYSQPTDDGIYFVKTWGGNQRDRGRGVTLDPNGNIYVSGETSSFGAGDWDILLFKYDRYGNTLWRRTWGGEGYDWITRASVVLDSKNNAYIAGSTGSFRPNGKEDVLLLKFDPDGNLLWQKTWGEDKLDYSFGTNIDTFDNIYITGITQNFGSGDHDIILLKFDSDGDLLWQRTWGGSGNEDCGYSIAIDQFGDIYVAGLTNSAGAGGEHPRDKDGLNLKFESDGNLLWQKTWGRFDVNEWAIATNVDTANNLYASGWATNPETNDLDIFLLKLSPSGDLIWQRTWGGATRDAGFHVETDPKGNVYISGITASTGAGSQDVILLEISSSGTLLSQVTWGSAGNDGPHVSMTLSESGILFVTGEVQEPPYTLGTPNFKLKSPNIELLDASIDLGFPSIDLYTPNGSIGTPKGSEYYAGGRDLFLLKYKSP